MQRLRRLLLVIRHARAMWRVLSHPKNVAKGGWDSMSRWELLQLAGKELEELKAAAWGFEHHGEPADRVADEAADVSAFVAMVADRCR